MIGAIAANLLPWSLQAAGVVAAAALLPWLFRLDVAGVRYAYWRGVALLCLMLPWIQPYRRGHSAAASVTTDVALAAAQGQSASAPTPGVNWGSIVLTLVVIGVLLRLLWLAVGLIKLQRLRRAAIRNQPAMVDADLQGALGTQADIRYAPELQQPVTFGVRRPLILLPDVLREQPTEIQRAVIGHELLHVKRRDWAWLIVEEIAVCLFWFHPASWWLASRIQCAREEVVDELAILLTGRRKTYVEALLAFADTISVVPTAAFARRRHLLRRIALVSKEDVMSSRRIVVTCAAMAVIVGLGSWYAVSAFPLQSGTQTRRPGSMQPGSLELRAHAVTPENPIPRRVHYEPPVVSDLGVSIRADINVRLTLDEVGRVAEARVVGMEGTAGKAGMAIRTPPVSFNASEADLTDRGTRSLVSEGSGSADAGAVTRQHIQTLIEAALASVREWRYDPPFEPPLTFTVPVRISTGPEVMEFKPAREDDALRVGGNIKTPTKIKDVRPVYPPLAQTANVTGVVIIEVRIGTDGSVEEAHVLKSIPLLDQAALDAVKQWQFMPTLMNGVPTPLIMTVTVNFTQQ